MNCGCNAGGMCGCFEINGIRISVHRGEMTVRTTPVKVSLKYMTLATEAAKAGDTDAAMWYIREANAGIMDCRNDDYWPTDLIGTEAEVRKTRGL